MPSQEVLAPPRGPGRDGSPSLLCDPPPPVFVSHKLLDGGAQIGEVRAAERGVLAVGKREHHLNGTEVLADQRRSSHERLAVEMFPGRRASRRREARATP